MYEISSTNVARMHRRNGLLDVSSRGACFVFNCVVCYSCVSVVSGAPSIQLHQNNRTVLYIVTFNIFKLHVFLLQILLSLDALP